MTEEQEAATEAGQVSFAAPGTGFFDGGDRRSHLEQLRHLSQWSRRVLLVTGPRGIGKSMLYRQLSASLEPRAKAARISGSLINGAREVLSATVHGFGLAAPAEADTQVLRQLIREHARAQERSERFCVVLVDDAELLEPKALEHLLELTAGSPLRAVLFGEVRLVPAVERLAEPRGLGWHEIRLSAFGVEETRAYLQWRLNEQGSTEAVPFSDTQIRELTRLAEGLPGRIDQMANVLLARIQSAGDGPPGRRFPALHKALVAVLVVALALAYLVWQPEAPSEPEQLTRAEPLALPPQSADPDPAAATPPAATASAEIAPEPADTAAASLGESVKPLVPAAADPTVAGAAAAVPAAADAVSPLPAGGEAEPAQPAEAQPAPAEEAASSEPPAVTPPEPRQSAPRVRDSDWIMAQPASAWTLQLASFSTAERADAFLARQSSPERFARYRLRRNGRVLHVVVFGNFESRAAAEQAATRLPASVGRVDPWVRTFAQVQEAVGTFAGSG